MRSTRHPCVFASTAHQALSICGTIRGNKIGERFAQAIPRLLDHQSCRKPLFAATFGYEETRKQLLYDVFSPDWDISAVNMH